MKKVWFVQDYNSMRLDEVFTTKKAAMDKAQQTYRKVTIEPLSNTCIEFREVPPTRDDTAEPVCHVMCVPVRHNKRT